MNVPCTVETIMIDKDGKPIRKKPIIEGLDPLLIDKLVQALQEKSAQPQPNLSRQPQKSPDDRSTYSTQPRARPHSPLIKTKPEDQLEPFKRDAQNKSFRLIKKDAEKL